MANKFPKTLGACVDLAYKLNQERLAKRREFEAQLAVLEKAQQDLEDHIIGKFTAQEIESARGETATATVMETPLPTVKDWPAVWAFIKRHNAFDLLEKRIAKVAWRDRLESDPVPGIEVFVKKSLSLTKRN